MSERSYFMLVGSLVGVGITRCYFDHYYTGAAYVVAALVMTFIWDGTR